MQVKIEDYRGWAISFDTEKETFFVESDGYDEFQNKRSFAACKTFVDEYLKANSEFKPIRVQHMDSGKELIITGIRKDGAFTYEVNGEKKQLSKYDERGYIKWIPENQAHYEAIAKWSAVADNAHAMIRDIRDRITGKDLKEIKAELGYK